MQGILAKDRGPGLMRVKPFLIIQLRPEDEASDNEFEAIMRYGGLKNEDIVRLRLDQTGGSDVDLDEFTAIIVGGSPFDISVPRGDKSSLQLEIEAGFSGLLGDIVDRDFPFLGCCSGSSLLGSYCGAGMSGAFAEPVGGADVSLTEAGARDPLLEGFPGAFRVLVGHKEACDVVPPGSVLLATNATCPVQMFRVKHNIYATQFHPEGDAKGFAVRIDIYRNCGYFPPETAEDLIAAVAQEDVPEAHLILKRFVDAYRDSG